MGGNFRDKASVGSEACGDEPACEQVADVVLVAVVLPVGRIGKDQVI